METDHQREGAKNNDLRQRAREAVERATDYHGAPPSPAPDAETLAKLERAMLQLPRRTREIFLAHRINGMSYREIAEITGLSTKRVQRHMVRALIRLSRLLDGDERTPWQRWRERHINRWFR